MIKPPEILETPRLLLRLPVLEDAGAIFRKYAQDPEVTKYLIWRPHENISVTRDSSGTAVNVGTTNLASHG